MIDGATERLVNDVARGGLTPARICARPGCGHSEFKRRGSAASGHWLRGCRECPCPSFRTLAQHEAWTKLRENEGWMDEDDAHDAVKRLLELYP